VSTIEKAVARLRHRIEESVTSATRPAALGKAPRTKAVVSTEGGGFHLDLLSLDRYGVSADPLKDWRVVEEMRTIKRPLLRKAFGKGVERVDSGNLILVTSCLPAEGKTSLALSLALSIVAEKDVTALLVDADVLKPSLTRILGLEDRLGLLDLLENPEAQVKDVLIRPQLPGLGVIPSGRLDPHSTELLASERMAALVGELSRRYADRVILFDSTPLLASTQAVVMSQLVGQIVLVVEARKTAKASVQEAVERIDVTKSISVVLNKAAGGQQKRYYGEQYRAYAGSKAKSA